MIGLNEGKRPAHEVVLARMQQRLDDFLQMYRSGRADLAIMMYGTFLGSARVLDRMVVPVGTRDMVRSGLLRLQDTLAKFPRTLSMYEDIVNDSFRYFVSDQVAMRMPAHKAVLASVDGDLDAVEIMVATGNSDFALGVLRVMSESLSVLEESVIPEDEFEDVVSKLDEMLARAKANLPAYLAAFCERLQLTRSVLETRVGHSL